MLPLAIAAALAAAASPPAQQARLVPRSPLVVEFGACAARQLPDQARALMATRMDSAEERRRARRMAQSRSQCVHRRLRTISLHTGEFRGAVAEGLLENDPDALSRLRAMPQRPPVRPQAADGRAFVAAYARCIADADPARAARLLDISPAAPEHRTAFLEFGQLLSDCMPYGLQYRIDQFDVRNHIASRLYELAFPAVAAD